MVIYYYKCQIKNEGFFDDERNIVEVPVCCGKVMLKYELQEF